jgi:glycosyltransferase involved in cell wall biosynthesis
MNHDLAPSAWRYARRNRIPLVSYIWDLPPFRLGAGRSDPVIQIAGRLISIPRLGRRYITRRGYYSRLRFVARRSSAVWSPSQNSAAAVTQGFGVDARAVAFCYNSTLFGSPAASNRNAALAGDDTLAQGAPPRAGALRLLSVSRLVPSKNHEALIRVAAQLGAHVELIGRGPREAPLAALAKERGVPILIRSGLTGEELVAAYRRASVVVCPSRFEGLGLTGIEGAMCGTPVVASDIPAHREFLGAAAHFFTLDNDGSLADAISRAQRAGPPPTAQFARLTIRSAAERFAAELRAFL